MRIKELRIDRDIKQIVIADILKITQQQYSLYENEYREIKISHLIKLAKFYNTSIDYIVGITNEIKPYPKNKIRGI